MGGFGRPQRSPLMSPYIDNMIACCSFKPNGSNAPTLISKRGIASVARSTTGVYLVTLTDAFHAFLQKIPKLNMAAGATTYFAHVTDSSVANKTVTITFSTEAGVATDITGGPNDTCELFLVLAMTDLDPVGG